MAQYFEIKQRPMSVVNKLSLLTEAAAVVECAKYKSDAPTANHSAGTERKSLMVKPFSNGFGEQVTWNCNSNRQVGSVHSGDGKRMVEMQTQTDTDTDTSRADNSPQLVSISSTFARGEAVESAAGLQLKQQYVTIPSTGLVGANGNNPFPLLRADCFANYLASSPSLAAPPGGVILLTAPYQVASIGSHLLPQATPVWINSALCASARPATLAPADATVCNTPPACSSTSSCANDNEVPLPELVTCSCSPRANSCAYSQLRPVECCPESSFTTIAGGESVPVSQFEYQRQVERSLVNECLSSHCADTDSSLHQRNTPYKKRKVVRAFSDLTAERRATTQTSSGDCNLSRQPVNDLNASGAKRHECGSQSALVTHGYASVYGPSRRRVLVASSGLRSQSPFSLSSARSGASSPCSSISYGGSYANLDDSVASGDTESKAASCGSDALNAFRELSIESVATTPVSSGYATKLPSVASPIPSGCMMKASRSIVIVNVDTDEQIDEHFERSLLPMAGELSGKPRFVPNAKVFDGHLLQSPVERAASSACRSRLAAVKRTASCPLTLKRPASDSPTHQPQPQCPPYNAALYANVCHASPALASASVSCQVSAQPTSISESRIRADTQFGVGVVCSNDVPHIRVDDPAGNRFVLESGDVDEHFRKALGLEWSSVSKSQTAAALTQSYLSSTDAVETTHF